MQTDFSDQANFPQPQSCFSFSQESDYHDQEPKLSERQQNRGSQLAMLASETQIYSSIEENILQGNYAVVISLIDQLIALYPDSAINYNNRGLMYFQNNQIAEALDDLTHALEINPKLDSAYNNRANCYAAQGDFMAAVSDYDLALDLNPANLRAWINQGITFREMNSYDSALENFDVALILGNQLKEKIYAERGRTYHLRGDWNCAVADYQLALELLSNGSEYNNYYQKVRGWFDDLFYPLISY